MRMRKKKNLDSRLEACAPVLAQEPTELRGKWREEAFGNNNPLHLEIGCGKGRFILENARRYPNVNFVAIEKEEGALIMATEQAMREELPNLKFLSFDAAALGEIFADGEVDLIYLNFSDPWPPNRQRKRRAERKPCYSFRHFLHNLPPVSIQALWAYSHNLTIG